MSIGARASRVEAVQQEYDACGCCNDSEVSRLACHFKPVLLFFAFHFAGQPVAQQAREFEQVIRWRRILATQYMSQHLGSHATLPSRYAVDHMQ